MRTRIRTYVSEPRFIWCFGAYNSNSRVGSSSTTLLVRYTSSKPFKWFHIHYTFAGKVNKFIRQKSHWDPLLGLLDHRSRKSVFPRFVRTQLRRLCDEPGLIPRVNYTAPRLLTPKQYWRDAEVVFWSFLPQESFTSCPQGCFCLRLASFHIRSTRRSVVLKLKIRRRVCHIPIGCFNF